MTIRSAVFLTVLLGMAWTAAPARAQPKPKAGASTTSSKKPAGAKAEPGPGAAPPAPVTSPAPASGSKARPEDTIDLNAMPAEVLQALDTAPPKRIAITQFRVVGDNVPPALRYQLQDGFVLGLVRNGVQVIDRDDLPERLSDEPELIDCDTSPCLKRLGEKLRTRFVVTVEVQITGNSFRMIARIFRTTGAAPAALPIETQSRFCDICTVTEARDAMLRLADGVRVPDEPDFLGDNEVRSKPAPAPQVRSLSLPPSLAILGSGVASILIGTAILASSDDGSKGLHAFSGSLMTVGVTGTVFGLFSTSRALKKRRPAERDR